MLCLALFGFTTILGLGPRWRKRCLEYFSNDSMKAVKVYRWLNIAAVFSAFRSSTDRGRRVPTIADIFNACMAIPNIIALVALSGIVQRRRPAASLRAWMPPAATKTPWRSVRPTS